VGNLAVVRYLAKELGASVNLGNQIGATALYIAAHIGLLAVVRCLANELGADHNLEDQNGATPLYVTAQNGHLAVVRYLVKELRANVKKSKKDGTTPLHIAAQKGHLAVVRCLVEELGADVNLVRKGGATALMMAASKSYHKIVAYLMRHGADPQASAALYGTAAYISKTDGASAEQTAYLEAKTHCSNPGCGGAGIKKCTGCKQVRYCGQQCQLAHWPAHKADCKAAAELRASKGK
jgi:ankyrin repeat protein